MLKLKIETSNDLWYELRHLKKADVPTELVVIHVLVLALVIAGGHPYAEVGNEMLPRGTGMTYACS
jgi:hypothetical protein